MSRGGYYLPCPPVLYYVPDRGGVQPPAAVEQPLDMDVQIRSPAPFHYLIHEQAKSLVVLQELQNEVGALLEFRDVVMETFPHLRSKMAASEPARVHTPPSGGTAPRIKAKVRPPSSSTPVAASPPAAVAGAGWRDWGPGVRVRRKLKEPEAKKSVQRQPKSGGGGGGSGGEASSGGTASGSTVQDSGFSTETKDLHSSGTVTGPKSGAVASSACEAGRPSSSAALSGEDELWELLEVIQRKGTRLRREVEELQTRLEGGESSESDEGEVRRLRRERDMLLRRVAEMEAEAAGSEARVAQLQDEAGVLAEQRRELEERLRAALSRKPDPDPRALLPRSVRVGGGSRRGSSVGGSPGRASPCGVVRRPTSAAGSPTAASEGRDAGPEGGRISRSSSFRALVARKEAWEWPPTLGALDGIVSNPQDVTAVSCGAKRPDSRVIAAILKEENVLELRRHLLVTAMERETLRHKLEWVSMWRGEANTDLEKTKEENEDLRFQLEEKSIELEGTRARIRLLENMQERADTTVPSNKQSPNGFGSTSTPKEDINGSSTESAHYVASALETSGNTSRGRMQGQSSTLRTPPPSSRTPPSLRTPPSSRTPPLPTQSRSQSRTGRMSRIPLPPTKARPTKAPPSPIGRGGNKSGESMSSVSTLAAHRTDSSRKPLSISSDGGKSAAKTRVICLPHHHSSSNITSCRGNINPSNRCSPSPAIATAEHPFPDSLNASSAHHPEYFDSMENRPWTRRKSAHQEEFLSPTTSELSETFDSGRPLGGEGIYSPIADSLEDLPNSALETGQSEDGSKGGPDLWEVFSTVQSTCSPKITTPR